MYPSVYLRRAVPSGREGAPDSDHTLGISSRSLQRAELRSACLGPGSESGDISPLGNNPDKASLIQEPKSKIQPCFLQKTSLARDMAS